MFEHKLLNLYFGVTNLMEDPLIGDCFSDLRSSLSKTLPEWLSTDETEHKGYQNFVGWLIELINHGMAERSQGAFLALEYPQNYSSQTKGGTQRVLRAAEVLVAKVLKRVGVKWNGFVVTGFQDQGFSSHSEVINLPTDFRFSPEEWWGLFHEIGHVALYHKEFVDLLGHDVISAVINDVTLGEREGKLSAQVKNFIYEIGADSFDLYFCHRAEFDLYLKNIWLYVTQRGITDEHYVRYFCMFLYWKYFLVKKRVSFPRRMSISLELEEFKKKLGSLRLPCSSDRKLDEMAERLFKQYSPVLPVLHSVYTKTLRPKSLDAELRNPRLKHAVSEVLKGRICTDSIDDPDLFLLALNRSKNRLDCSSRMAAILSLWHTFMIEQS